MTIEQLVPTIVKALREIENEGVLSDFTRYETWLAQMVVGIVMERAAYLNNTFYKYNKSCPP